MFPDRMEITMLPKARQVVVAERWLVQLQWPEPPVNAQKTRPVLPVAKHFYGSTWQEIRDDAVINNYFAHFSDAVQALWNGKLQLIATEEGRPPETYDLVFKITRATDASGAHWAVKLCTFDYNKGPGPDNTDWIKGTIKLHLNSARPRTLTNDLQVVSGGKVTVTGAQAGVGHEFGHSLHNEHEYERTLVSDAEIRHKAYLGMMNIGQEIETKYATYIVEQLNYHFQNRLKTHKQFTARKKK
jgi:hypothetical protein